MFPILFNLKGAAVALIGAGAPTVCRLALLDREEASVSVFAPEAGAELEAAAGLRMARLWPDRGELRAVRLVFIAGLDADLAGRMAALARQAGVPVNTEDRPAAASDWRKSWRTEGLSPSEITRRTRARMVKRGWL